MSNHDSFPSDDGGSELSSPAQRRPRIIVYTHAARFPLGRVVATTGALTMLERTGFSAAALLSRHIHGDWGDVCSEDGKSNGDALVYGGRVMSVYRLIDAAALRAMPTDARSKLPTVWIITEADRSVTTLLLPGDY